MKKNKESELKKEQPIENLISNTIKEIKSMVDSDIVVGKKIVDENNKQIFPISKISVGFVAGGGEYSKKEEERFPYAGGSGAGFSVVPMGVLIVDKGEVQYLKIAQSDPIIKLLDRLPDCIDSLTKRKEK